MLLVDGLSIHALAECFLVSKAMRCNCTASTRSSASKVASRRSQSRAAERHPLILSTRLLSA